MSGCKSSQNIHHANTEAQLYTIYHEENQVFQPKEDIVDSSVMQLKSEHTHLVRQMSTLNLQTAALKIETNHLEQREQQQQQLNFSELCFNQKIKSALLNSAQQALNEEEPIAFPKHFLTQIFSIFGYDQDFTKQCHHNDELLDKEVQKLCDREYEVQELRFKEKVKKKLTSTRTKLKEKYNAKLSKLEENQKLNVLKMKQKCYEVVRQLLIENCKDEKYIKSYLKELEALYTQDTDHL